MYSAVHLGLLSPLQLDYNFRDMQALLRWLSGNTSSYDLSSTIKHDDTVNTVAISLDGKILASGGEHLCPAPDNFRGDMSLQGNGGTRLWSVETLKPLSTPDYGKAQRWAVASAAWTIDNDGRPVLAYGTVDGRVIIWRGTTVRDGCDNLQLRH